MTHIILFKDNPHADADIRRAHMAEHLNFLQANEDKIAAAGPLFDNTGAGAGGIWLVGDSDLAAIDQLIRQDPFWPTGLRASYDILHWKVVFENLSLLRPRDPT
ncbi:YciI family protein [Ruegeria sp. EL01]|jgi:uncharacterized protein YciI|uniref:YciI family protein n=1 Tax=Ruegeria sp. EL01 TaxID=2107578 RepID=UPI000EA81A0E|nr:YciI family protein [Ruegeria sp. EL01]